MKAARKAFESWSRTTREERMDVLTRIMAELKKRHEDMAAITEEMGAPVWLAQRAGGDGRRAFRYPAGAEVP